MGGKSTFHEDHPEVGNQKNPHGLYLNNYMKASSEPLRMAPNTKESSSLKLPYHRGSSGIFVGFGCSTQPLRRSSTAKTGSRS